MIAQMVALDHILAREGAVAIDAFEGFLVSV